ATGDVFGLGLLAWGFGEQRTRNDVIALDYHDVRTGRNWIIRSRFVMLIENDDLRMEVLFMLDDDDGFLTGELVDFFLHRDTFNDVVEAHGARLFGDDGNVVRI